MNGWKYKRMTGIYYSSPKISVRKDLQVNGQKKVMKERQVGCWLVVLFYDVSTLFESFNTESNFKQFSLV